jgi:hypothetical protein
MAGDSWCAALKRKTLVELALKRPDEFGMLIRDIPGFGIRGVVII